MHLKPTSRERSWSPQSSPTGHTMFSRSEGSQDPSSPMSNTSFSKKEDKLPHNASVFVGSLPSNIDHAELTRMLTEHLSEHTQVKNIKVVRDSKGGVCAFVQCENAHSASSLIQTLQTTTPKLFLGRMLRFETARAFRTLLISYRAPSHFVNGKSFDQDKYAIGDLELPSAMWICKPRGSRFHSILYNAEALESEERTNNDTSVEDDHIFMQPVQYDGASIRKLAAYFGRLEKFDLYEHGGVNIERDDVPKDEPVDEDMWKAYPPPHNAPRLSMMENCCWEIKWDHRDDCVGALMTLRRVPHLTVTWAHQPSSTACEPRSPNQNHFIPHVSPMSYLRHPSNISLSSQLRSPPTFAGRQQILSSSSRDSLPSNTTPGHPHKRTAISIEGQIDQPPSVKPIHPWSPSEHEIGSCANGLLRTPWAETDFTEKNIDWTSWSSVKTELNNPETVPILPVDDSKPDLTPTEQKGCISHVSSLGMSPATPSTPSPLYPLTPTSGNCKETYRELDILKEDTGHQSHRDIDPASLFVGGLEIFGPAAWDEDKVTQYFSRFGGLESVQVVRPFNASSGFAFIKFNNTEGPARAVLEEHNRVCDGRVLRVQLRDCNPPRGPWRHARGRSRFQHHPTTPRRFNYMDRLAAKNVVHRNQNTGSPLPHGEHIPLPEKECELASRCSPVPPLYKGGEVVADLSALPSPGESNSLEPKGGDTFANTEGRDQIPNYREWYDDLEPSITTSASSPFSSSTPVTMISPPTYPYIFPNNPYYAHAPWMQPYVHQAQYPMHYYSGYPMYPPLTSSVSQTLTSPSGSDTSAVAGTSPTWPPIGTYGPQYHAYQMARNIVMGQGQPQPLNGGVQNGFMQNEHPALVYQQDNTEQYMAGHNIPLHASHPPLNPNVQPWTPYPQSYPSQPTGIPPRPLLQSAGSVNWVASQGAIPIVPSPSMSSNSQRHASPFLAMHNGHDGSPDSPHLANGARRHGNRRDPQFSVHGRNAIQRSFGGRNPRNHAAILGSNNEGDIPSKNQGPQMAVVSTREWTSTR